MNLFEDVEAENEKYINILDALEVAAKKINYSVSDIARRLLLDEFNKAACMFKINDYGKIDIWCSEKELNGNYAITTEFLKLAISTDGTFDYTETDNYGNEYRHIKDHWFEYYWLKSDFLNFPSIRKIGISEEYYKNSLKADNEEAFYDLVDQLTKQEEEKEAKEKAKNVSIKFLQEVAEFEPNQELGEDIVKSFNNQSDLVKELNEEIEKLKAELLGKDQKIKELESLSYKEDTDLLSLIFDKTEKERYSPDLVLSIKLWEHVYIVNPKDDSHSNKADTWLKANTGYDVGKKAGSASKIREITAPFINWSTHRDKGHEK